MRKSKFDQANKALANYQDERDYRTMCADAAIASSNRTSVAQLIAADINNAIRAGISLEPNVVY